MHADELEYTPQGLRMREPLPLEVGTTNRIEIRRPAVIKAVPLGFGGFPSDSSFPTPVALSVLLSPISRRLFDGDARPYYQLYGHAQRDGSEAHNKRLSDRRAQVMRAMLVCDVDSVLGVSTLEHWGAAEQQVMLRVLHCDPGPIDGKLGALSRAAVRDFQEDYRDGVFHRHGRMLPRHPGLAVDGVLGPNTARALVEAYVSACSPALDEGQLHPTHPVVGCSEYNPLLDEQADSAANRRVTLVVHDQLPPFHDRAPCTEGEHMVCPVDEEAQRCPWYRAHVDDLEEDRPHRHSDLRWLPLPDGRVVLSAITTMMDGETVEFRVHRSLPIDGPEQIQESKLGEALSEALTGTVRMGVALTLWTPSQGVDPFDADSWYPPLSYDEVMGDPMAPWGEGNRIRPPLFRVVGGGVLTPRTDAPHEADRVHAG
ncbi:MAG: hypothetical protein AB1Z98_02930 [Nannocystaceae bacterium]